MRVRAGLVVTGVLIMAYAVTGGLGDRDVRPGGVLLFLAAVLVGHDAVWMPILLAGVSLLARPWRTRDGRSGLSRKNFESPEEGGAAGSDR